MFLGAAGDIIHQVDRPHSIHQVTTFMSCLVGSERCVLMHLPNSIPFRFAGSRVGRRRICRTSSSRITTDHHSWMRYHPWSQQTPRSCPVCRLGEHHHQSRATGEGRQRQEGVPHVDGNRQSVDSCPHVPATAMSACIAAKVNRTRAYSVGSIHKYIQMNTTFGDIKPLTIQMSQKAESKRLCHVRRVFPKTTAS